MHINRAADRIEPCGRQTKTAPAPISRIGQDTNGDASDRIGSHTSGSHIDGPLSCHCFTSAVDLSAARATRDDCRVPDPWAFYRNGPLERRHCELGWTWHHHGPRVYQAGVQFDPLTKRFVTPRRWRRSQLQGGREAGSFTTPFTNQWGLTAAEVAAAPALWAQVGTTGARVVKPLQRKRRRLETARRCAPTRRMWRLQPLRPSALVLTHPSAFIDTQRELVTRLRERGPELDLVARLAASFGAMLMEPYRRHGPGGVGRLGRGLRGTGAGQVRRRSMQGLECRLRRNDLALELWSCLGRR